MTTIILIAVSLVIAGLRISGIIHPSYQAAAHVWVGILFGMWLMQRKIRNLNIWLVIALSIVEIACSVWFKFFAQ